MYPHAPKRMTFSYPDKVANLKTLLALIFVMNLGLLFTPDILYSFTTLIPVILFNLFIWIDVFLRPHTTRKQSYTTSNLLYMFVFLPLIVILPYLEYRWLLSPYIPPWTTAGMLMSGIFTLVVGGLVLLASRRHLGRFGDLSSVFTDKHRLVTDGPYRYVRHPQYLGFLMLFLGYTVSVGSVFTTIITCIGFFMVIRLRIRQEEEWLIERFGEEYIQYRQHTRQLIPHIY